MFVNRDGLIKVLCSNKMVFDLGVVDVFGGYVMFFFLFLVLGSFGERVVVLLLIWVISSWLMW